MNREQEGWFCEFAECPEFATTGMPSVIGWPSNEEGYALCFQHAEFAHWLRQVTEWMWHVCDCSDCEHTKSKLLNQMKFHHSDFEADFFGFFGRVPIFPSSEGA